MLGSEGWGFGGEAGETERGGVEGRHGWEGVAEGDGASEWCGDGLADAEGCRGWYWMLEGEVVELGPGRAACVAWRWMSQRASGIVAAAFGCGFNHEEREYFFLINDASAPVEAGIADNHNSRSSGHLKRWKLG